MNIIDFVKINGSKSFDEVPYCEIDSLIFAQLAYLKYENIFTSFNDVIDTRNLNAYETSILLLKDDERSIAKFHKKLVREVLSSTRYYGMKIGYYVNEHDFENHMQFGAISFIFDNFICISYMGTDNSIVGWKEDFNMSFMDKVPSQDQGIEYMEMILDKYHLPLILTGHSKGGNVAIYTLCNSKEDSKNMIIKAYSFDSPGFNKHFFEDDSYLQVSHKIEAYIPESSFIGLIMYPIESQRIVASDKLFIFQHNMYNWLLDEKGFIYKENLSKKSQDFALANRKWIESFTDEERKIFFDNIFGLLENNDIVTFSDLKRNWKDKAKKIINDSKEISEENKILMSNIIKNLFYGYVRLLFTKKSTK